MKRKHNIFIIIAVVFALLGVTGYLIGEKVYDKSTSKENTIPIAANNTEVEESRAASNGSVEYKPVVNTEEQAAEHAKYVHNDTSIPILYYHSIAYEKGNELRLPKERFREQMKYLKDNGYFTLSLDDLYDFLLNDKPVPEKSIVITFDDGYEDNYTNAYPVMKEFGFKGTIFVITSAIDHDASMLTSKQIQEMDANGMDIESHTVNHDDLVTLSYNNQLKTLKESKETLESLLNKKVNYFAYPFGHYNKDTFKAVEESGYKLAFNTLSGWSNKTQGSLELRRVYVSANHDMAEFERRLTNPNYDVK